MRLRAHVAEKRWMLPSCRTRHESVARGPSSPNASRKQLIAFKSSTRIGQILCNMLILKENTVKIALERWNQSYLFWLSDARNMHKILGIRGFGQNQICNFAGDEPKVHLLSCFH